MIDFILMMLTVFCGGVLGHVLGYSKGYSDAMLIAIAQVNRLKGDIVAIGERKGDDQNKKSKEAA